MVVETIGVIVYVEMASADTCKSIQYCCLFETNTE